MVVLMMKDIPMTICQFKEFIKGEIMKDYAHKLHKPRQPKPWHDVAREMTENIIFVALMVFIIIVIARAVI